jgi:murein DD-endopeptidase MepM/ murein hydrolase activator NlpD
VVRPTLLALLLLPSVVAIAFVETPLSGSTTAQERASSPNVDGAPRLSGKQGQILYLRVKVEDHTVSVLGTLLGRRIPFFDTSEDEFAALVGIDMADAPGTVELMVEITSPEGTRQQSFAVAVAAEDFRDQRLTLPKDQVDPDAAALKRITREREKIQSVFGSPTPERLWRQPFLVPVDGVVTGAFGSRRILNGQPRNQHNGEDIAAPLGTPLKATNNGIVRMVDDHFFSGRSVILDHGLGLYTMYSHLQTAKVKEGDRIERGQIIGTVGKSGRATGPHLHWGAWLNGSRVNPFSLTRLPVESTP